MDRGAWWAAVHVAKSQTRLSDFTFTFPFHALEKEMATHSSALAWRIPGMAEPGGLPSMGIAQSRTQLKWLSSSILKKIIFFLQTNYIEVQDSLSPAEALCIGCQRSFGILRLCLYSHCVIKVLSFLLNISSLLVEYIFLTYIYIRIISS